MPKALAAYELKFGNEVPSGTYLDMAVNMPMVDPLKLKCPVCLIRAEHDGNASEEELLRFYSLLPNKDKQFAMIAGIAHAGALGINRHRHVARHARLPDLSADAERVMEMRVRSRLGDRNSGLIGQTRSCLSPHSP